ncbi:sigma 54-interacting transcriptional regulator [Mucilaginibacter polytrichastri]|uniref:Hydrogenase-4 transcriptional activator n=1 Tax=Mucilaginibacter polytrichastri TaxID=1302689 RepID=A0A1Q5ZY90_9SPHI|nr:sigma 54-interacting transcriptional regulator [Mucilaginibacter polytrichastri]OKS86708.1 Hydrogenase-4 transcriptional activator [Mucilaginibacter polytrichastri]SFS82493.1 Transcriptional regulator containing GAF, AAA-type ATPase, and DNA-binding Fis domains [Mucilaginibacter polytrichastri]
MANIPVQQGTNTSVLIVEDHFIEANSLSIILERSGYAVSFIAKSVDQAYKFFEKSVVDIVIVDIFLKGKLTGIDLAISLNKLGIPFIYLSANSNPSVFELAKETNPYGFLVKPFREKDVLTAIEIAKYRHAQEKDIISKSEQWVSDILVNNIKLAFSTGKKVLQLAKALEPLLAYDYLVVFSDLDNIDKFKVYIIRRIGPNDYKEIDGQHLFESANLQDKDYQEFNDAARTKFLPQFYVLDEFIDESYKSKVSLTLKEELALKSGIELPLLLDSKNLLFYFYNNDFDSFNAGSIETILRLKPLISNAARYIFNADLSSQGTSDIGQQVEKSKSTQLKFPGIVGQSARLIDSLNRIYQVAAFETTVLILGETGVGKEGLVHVLHSLSERKVYPLIKVNCAAIPADLMESELFGHEKGAFTDAREKKIGKFEQANGGTIFLDEIGEMPLALQSKLLRVIQEKEFERIGGRTTLKADVRIVAATNRNLHKAISEGNFRMDLYYRINVFPITLAPLRERRSDIKILAVHFLEANILQTGKNIRGFTPEVMDQMEAYSWPGNIRELQHVIERAVLLTDTAEISSIDLEEEFDLPSNPEITLKSHVDPFKPESIVEALRQTNGKVSGKGGAAVLLGVPAPALTYQMKKLGIVWRFIYDE